MRYQNYQIEDFLQDEAFVKWVREPDAESIDFWEGWLKNYPSQIDKVAKAKELILLLEFQEPVASATEQEYNEVFQNILKHQPQEKKYLSPTKQRSLWTFNLKKLAAILIIPILGLAYWQFSPQRYIAQNERPKINWITKECPLGRKMNLKLPDGTIVKLNSGSTLKFPEKFDDSLREVHLTGEGYFNVTHDAKRRFNLHAGSLKVSVLGTSFNVNAYEDNQIHKVSLVEGKVALQREGKDEKIILEPNEAGVFNLNNASITTYRFNNREDLSWTQGVLFFNQSSFNEVIKKLGRWYGVEFKIIKKPKREEGLNGEFNNTSLDRVLEVLSHTSGFQYEINKNIVTIK